MMSDTKTHFSKNHGWDAGMGDRNGRWAMVIEKDGTISYAENEKSPGQVTVSRGGQRMYLMLTMAGFWSRGRPLQALDRQFEGLIELSLD